MTPVYNITSTISIMPHPMGGKHLGAEIKKFAAAGFETLICLVTAEELKLLGLEDEKIVCSASRIDFIHFPIKDFGVPDKEEDMIGLAEELEKRIRTGKKIIIHCRGGIGRSSLLACTLLMQQGLSCAEAIDLVSRKRGCRIPETEEQERWLKRLHTTIEAKKASLKR